jgi:hypothetical protein
MARALMLVSVIVALGGLVRLEQSWSAKPPVSSRLSLVKVSCYGIERWSVKTLSDPGRASARISQPVKSSVADVWSRGRRKGSPALGETRARGELKVYTVTGRLVKARFVDDSADASGKGGGDRDIHLVIAAPKDKAAKPKTMIVEFPDPGCVKAADPGPRALMAAARKALATSCGHAPKHAFYDLSGTATITGVGFYDRPHGDGRALHGFELHPVIAFRSSDCKWGPKSPAPDPRMLNLKG